PIPPDQCYMKSWNNKQSQLQRLVSSPLSTLEPAFSHPRIRSEANTIPISQFHKISIFLQLCFLDSISSTSFLTKLMRLLIEDWRPILLECISKTVHSMPRCKISLYVPQRPY